MTSNALIDLLRDCTQMAQFLKRQQLSPAQVAAFHRASAAADILFAPDPTDDELRAAALVILQFRTLVFEDVQPSTQLTQ